MSHPNSLYTVKAQFFPLLFVTLQNYTAFFFFSKLQNVPSIGFNFAGLLLPSNPVLVSHFKWGFDYVLGDGTDEVQKQQHIDNGLWWGWGRENAQYEGVSESYISDSASEKERWYATLCASWGLLNRQL